MPEKPLVFISHITEEKELALILKEALMEAFEAKAEVFVSSDEANITLGSPWLTRIEESLKAAVFMLILCSKRSADRRWVNWEGGVAWARQIPVTPVCHTDLKPSGLPMPLASLQGITLSDEAELKKLFQRLGKTVGLGAGDVDYARLLTSIRQFESEYGFAGVVRPAIANLIRAIPELRQLFSTVPVHRHASGPVPQTTLERIRSDLDLLQSKGLIRYSLGKVVLAFGENVGGMQQDLSIFLQPAFDKVAASIT